MSNSKNRPEFEEVDVLHDDDGLVAVITSRVKANGRKAFSFSLMKEYERDATTMRTCWLGNSHVDAARRLLDRVEKRLELEEDRYRAAARRSV